MIYDVRERFFLYF